VICRALDLFFSFFCLSFPFSYFFIFFASFPFFFFSTRAYKQPFSLSLSLGLRACAYSNFISFFFLAAIYGLIHPSIPLSIHLFIYLRIPSSLHAFISSSI
jgi:hypothetical protein